MRLYGGIYPFDLKEEAYCFHCGKETPWPDHIIESFQTFIHAGCIHPFLETERGKKLKADGNVILMRSGDKLVVIE